MKRFQVKIGRVLPITWTYNNGANLYKRPTPASFFISFFLTTFLHKIVYQQDSKLDRWRRGQAQWPLYQHHGPLRAQIFFLAWPSQDVFLLLHIPWIGQGGSILLVLCSTIILLAHHFFVFSGDFEVWSHSYLQPARPHQHPFQDEQISKSSNLSKKIGWVK